MSKHAKYVPKHRHASTAVSPRRIVRRTTVLMSSAAVVATGVAVSGGVLGSAGPGTVAADDLGAQVSAPIAGTRTVREQPVVSRSSIDRRDSADPAKQAALSVDSGPAVTRSVDVADADPRQIAQALMPKFGFSADQFGCLDSLWTRESNWNPSAHNPSSGAHGIPQSLPGSKMASVGPDWATNPVTQITWGLGYIQGRYGSPCGAWGHSQAYGWY